MRQETDRNCISSFDARQGLARPPVGHLHQHMRSEVPPQRVVRSTQLHTHDPNRDRTPSRGGMFDVDCSNLAASTTPGGARDTRNLRHPRESSNLAASTTPGGARDTRNLRHPRESAQGMNGGNFIPGSSLDGRLRPQGMNGLNFMQDSSPDGRLKHNPNEKTKPTGNASGNAAAIYAAPPRVGLPLPQPPPCRYDARNCVVQSTRSPRATLGDLQDGHEDKTGLRCVCASGLPLQLKGLVQRETIARLYIMCMFTGVAVLGIVGGADSQEYVFLSFSVFFGVFIPVLALR
jgi:hypothetical protein